MGAFTVIRYLPVGSRVRAIASVLLLVAPAGACDSGEREPDGISDHVELYVEDDVEVCAGQLDAYERFIERAFNLWVGATPDDFIARVHVTQDTPCTIRNSCATPGNVWLGQQPEQFHELAHVVVAAVDGRSNAALTEGAAEALGPRSLIWQVVDLGPEVLGRDIAGLDTEAYSTMGVTTRFLIERYGIEAFRAYYRMLGEHDDPLQSEIEQKFELAFGDTVPDVWPILQSEQRCTFELWYCDAAPRQALPVEIDDLDCGDPGVMGYVAPRFEPSAPQPTVEPFSPQRVVQFRLETDQRLELEIGNADVHMIRCGACADRPQWMDFGTDEASPGPAEIDMEAGTYAAVVRQYGNGPLRFSVTRAE